MLHSLSEKLPRPVATGLGRIWFTYGVTFTSSFRSRTGRSNPTGDLGVRDGWKLVNPPGGQVFWGQPPYYGFRISRKCIRLCPPAACWHCVVFLVNVLGDDFSNVDRGSPEKPCVLTLISPDLKSYNTSHQLQCLMSILCLA